MEEYNSGDDSAYEQTTLKQFYEIKYGEVINAINFFKPDAVYSTDHGVKGEEYENVLFVMGRGLQHTLGIETCFTCVVPGRGRDSLF